MKISLLVFFNTKYYFPATFSSNLIFLCVSFKSHTSSFPIIKITSMLLFAYTFYSITPIIGLQSHSKLLFEYTLYSHLFNNTAKLSGMKNQFHSNMFIKYVWRSVSHNVRGYLKIKRKPKLIRRKLLIIAVWGNFAVRLKARKEKQYLNYSLCKCLECRL